MQPRKFKKCKKCGTTEKKILAGGICLDCNVESFRKTREKKEERESGEDKLKIRDQKLKEERLQKREHKLKEYFSKKHAKKLTKYNYNSKKSEETKQKISTKLRKNRRTRTAGVISKKLTKEYLTEEYLKNKKSFGDIAKECGCSRGYVHKKFRSYNLPLRDKSAARELVYDQKKISYEIIDADGQSRIVTHQKINFNKDFFTTWSPEMAWVLGVIFTDGNIWKGTQGKGYKGMGRLQVAQKEPEILNKLLALIECDAKLFYLKRREYKNTIAGELYTFSINSNKLYHDLICLGVTPDKSLDMKLPDIPQEYVRHFIRGCWDGDGSVYIDKRGKFGASYTCGSLMFVEGMLSKLEQAGLPKRTIYRLERKSISYYFKFTGRNCKKLFHYLYDDVPSTQYLGVIFR